LPSQYRRLEVTGRLDNFRRASGKTDGEFQGIYFNDSDVFKCLEATTWTLAEGPDPELDKATLRHHRTVRRGCDFSLSEGLKALRVRPGKLARPVRIRESQGI
jgi:hypothetical protein